MFFSAKRNDRCVKARISTVPVCDLTKRAVGRAQIESCDITHSWDACDNKENLNKNNETFSLLLQQNVTIIPSFS